MARIKVKHEKNFTIVQNDFIYDKNLPVFEKGLLLVLLSKKDDFQFSIGRLEQELKESYRKIMKSLSHLEECGYLSREQTFSEKKYGTMTYFVSDVPCFSEETRTDENSTAENSTAENSTAESSTAENSTAETSTAETSTAESNTAENSTAEIDTPLLSTNTTSTNKSRTNIPSTTPTTPKQKKIAYAQAVTMTEQEREKLEQNYGKAFTEQCIQTLNAYKLSSGKTYKSDYFAMLNWVVDRVREKHPEICQKPLDSAKFDDSVNPFGDVCA